MIKPQGCCPGLLSQLVDRQALETRLSRCVDRLTALFSISHTDNVDSVSRSLNYFRPRSYHFLSSTPL